MTFERVVVDECVQYERNGLSVMICSTKTKIFVTVASKSFALHILPNVEALISTFGNTMREVYWNHERGTVTIVDYLRDEDEGKLIEVDADEVKSSSEEAKEILREFEEIANDLLDKAAVLVAFNDRVQ